MGKFSLNLFMVKERTSASRVAGMELLPSNHHFLCVLFLYTPPEIVTSLWVLTRSFLLLPS